MLMWHFVDVDVYDSNFEKKMRVIRRLVQMEISQDVSKAAVQCNRSFDLDECYLWALEHEYDKKMIAIYQKSFDDEVGELLGRL